MVVLLALLARGAFRLLPPEFAGNRLLNAARDGNIPRARLLLLLGSDVNYSTNSGTALHLAAGRGDTALLEFLLRHGANPNSTAKFSVTPLYYARIYGHPAAERILLACGANPDTSHISPP
jgi:ankyrin repeat protein